MNKFFFNNMDIWFRSYNIKFKMFFNNEIIFNLKVKKKNAINASLVIR